jgi:hypothetical protein
MRYNLDMNALTVQQESSIFERLLVSPDSAQALLSIRFSPADQQKMQELMEKNNQGTITPEVQAEMEAFRQIGSFLAIAQAQARLRLKSSNGDGHSAA